MQTYKKSQLNKVATATLLASFLAVNNLYAQNSGFVSDRINIENNRPVNVFLQEENRLLNRAWYDLTCGAKFIFSLGLSSCQYTIVPGSAGQITNNTQTVENNQGGTIIYNLPNEATTTNTVYVPVSQPGNVNTQSIVSQVLAQLGNLVGIQGPKGDKGDKGDAGTGVVSTTQSPTFYSTYSLGGQYTGGTGGGSVSTVVGPQGAQGPAGTSVSSITASGSVLTITYSNGQTATTSVPTIAGTNGATGTGISAVVASGSTLIFTYSDGATTSVAMPTTNTLSYTGDASNTLESNVNGILSTTSIDTLNNLTLTGTTTSENIVNSGNFLTNFFSAVTGYISNLFFDNATGTNITATGTASLANIINNTLTSNTATITDLTVNGSLTISPTPTSTSTTDTVLTIDPVTGEILQMNVSDINILTYLQDNVAASGTISYIDETGATTTISLTTLPNLTVTGNTTLATTTATNLSVSGTTTLAGPVYATNTTLGGDTIINGTTTISGTTTVSGALDLSNASVTGLSLESATITNLVGTNASITNATTTNFFSDLLTALTGYFTNLFTQNLTASTTNTVDLLATNATLTNATITNLSTTNALSATGNTLTSNVGGSIGTSSIITSNGLTASGTVLTSTVNGVATSTDLQSIINSGTTNVLTVSTTTNSFTLTSTVNGVTATTTANFIDQNSLSSAVNELTSVVNGVTSTSSIINSNTLSAAAGVITSTVNGVVATTSISSLYNFLASSTNSNLTVATDTLGNVTYIFTDNPIFGSATITNAVITNASTTNLFSTNASITNATTSNFFADVLSAITGYISNLFFDNATGTNITATGTASLANIINNTLTSNTATITDLTVNGSLTISPTPTSTSTTDTVLTIDPVTGEILQMNVSDINILTYLQDNVAASGTISYIDETGATTTISLTTLPNLTVTGNTTLATTTATNLSVSGTTTLAGPVYATNTTLGGDTIINGTTTISGTTTVSGALDLSNASVTGLSLDSATITNLVGTNASITNATTTNFFSDLLTALTGYFTNLFTQNLTASTTNTVDLLATNTTLTNATITNLSTTNALSATGNTLTSNVGGSIGTSSIITSNGLTASGTVLTSTVNGVATSTDLQSIINSGTTNVLTVSTTTNSFTLTSTVNGVTATTTANFIDQNSLSSAVNELTSVVNGVTSTSSIINSNTLSAAAGVITSTVNGVVATTSISSLYNFLASSTNSNLTVATDTLGNVTYIFTDNPIFGSATITNAVITNASTTNLFSTNASITNATTSNFFADVLSAITGYISNLFFDNATGTNITATGTASLANIINNTLTSNTATITDLTVNGSLTISPTPTSTSTTDTVLTIDPVTGEILQMNVSDINILTYLQDNVAASGTISYIDETGATTTISLTTLPNLTVTGNTTLATTTATNLSVSGTTTLAGPVYATNTTLGGDTIINGTTTISGTTTVSGALDLSNASVTGLSLDSATITNLVGTNASITNATTSNFFSDLLTALTGYFTNLFTQNLTASTTNTVDLLATNATLTNATITNLSTTNALSATGNTLTSNVGGSIGTSSIITSNGLTASGTVLTSTVNGVATSTDLQSIINSGTTNILTVSTSTNSFTLTSTVNGVTSTTTANFIDQNSLSSAVNELTSVVNGVTSTSSIINSNTLTAAAGVITSTVNGVVATTSISSLYNFLASSTNSNLTVATDTLGNVTYIFTDNPIFGSATITNAVITNATSTNLFSTNASITNATTSNFFADVLSAITGYISNLFFENATGTNLTSGNITATSTATLGTTTLTSVASGTATSSLLVIGANGEVQQISTADLLASNTTNTLINASSTNSILLTNTTNGVVATTSFDLVNSNVLSYASNTETLTSTVNGVVATTSLLGTLNNWYSTVTNAPATSNTENVYQMANVGINNSNPLYTLDVSGMLNETATLTSGRTTAIHSGDNVAGFGIQGVGMTTMDPSTSNLSYINVGDATSAGGFANQATVGINGFSTGNSAKYLSYVDGSGNYIGTVNTFNGTAAAETIWATSSVRSTVATDSLFHSSLDLSPTLLDLYNANLRMNWYPNTRNDSASTSPINFLYTDAAGNVLSAPTSSLFGAIPVNNGLTNNAGTVQLGGTLIQDTVVDGQGLNMSFIKNTLLQLLGNHVEIGQDGGNTFNGAGYQVAMGNANILNTDYNTAIGDRNTVGGSQSVAIGYDNVMDSNNSYTIGYNNKGIIGSKDNYLMGESNDFSAAAGSHMNVFGSYNVGQNATDYTTVIGLSNTIDKAGFSTVVGRMNTLAGVNNSYLFGENLTATADQVVEFGTVDSTKITLDAMGRMYLRGALNVVNGDGNSNDVLISQGAGAQPKWVSMASITPSLLYYKEDTTAPTTAPAVAAGTQSVAIGDGAVSNAAQSMTFGINSTTTGKYSTTVGMNNINDMGKGTVVGLDNEISASTGSFITGGANTLSNLSESIVNAISTTLTQGTRLFIGGSSNVFNGATNENNQIIGNDNLVNGDLYLTQILGNQNTITPTTKLNIILGSNNTITSGDVTGMLGYSNIINASNAFAIGENLNNVVNGSIDLGLQDATKVTIDDLGRLTLRGALNVTGTDGNLGEILISQGSGVMPLWTSPTAVLASSTTNVATTSGNILSSTVNGVLATTTVISTSSLTFATSTNILTSMINGFVSTTSLAGMLCENTLVGIFSFCNGGNTSGANATLGTNDSFAQIFETNNTERMRIDANGNIGIGTTTPAYKLVVNSTANPLQLTGLQAGTSTDFLLSADANGVVRELATSSLGGMLCPGSTTIFCQNGNTFGAAGVLGTNDNFPVVIKTNNTNRVTVGTTGIVTIGTTAQIIPNYAGSANAPAGALINTIGSNNLVLGGSATGTPGYGVNIIAYSGLANYRGLTYNSKIGVPDLLLQQDGGNVGVGTTTPGNQLTIASSSGAVSGLRLAITSATAAATSTGKFLAVNANGDVYQSNLLGLPSLAVGTTTLAAGKVATFAGDIDVTGTIDPTRILFTNLAGVDSPTWNPSANGNNYKIEFAEGGNLNFGSNTTADILHLTNLGDVGVGTSAPTAKFHINTGLASTSALKITDGTNYTLRSGYQALNTGYFGGATGTALALGADDKEWARLTTDGVLGLRTSTPNTTPGFNTNALEFWDADGGHSDFTQRVAGGGYGTYNMLAQGGTLAAPTISAANQRLGMYGWGGYTGSGFNYAATQYADIDGIPSATSMPGKMKWATTPAGSLGFIERMVLDSKGNLGLGNSFPVSRLHVSDATTTGDVLTVQEPSNRTAGANIKVLATGIASAGTATGPAGIQINMNAAGFGGLRYIRFANSAGTEIGSISRNGANSVSYLISSDSRLKLNQRDSKYGLDDLMKIEVKDFNWISDNSEDNGFIAQQLSTIYPVAVTKGDSGSEAYVPGQTNTWSVDYGRVTPLLTKSIQDLAKLTVATTSADSLRSILDSLASSTSATSTLVTLADGSQVQEDTFVGKFWKAMTERMITWFSETTNGITNFFAKKVYTEEVCLKKADGTDLCVTGDQLQTVMTNQGAQTTVVQSTNTVTTSTTTDGTTTSSSSTLSCQAGTQYDSTTNSCVTIPSTTTPDPATTTDTASTTVSDPSTTTVTDPVVTDPTTTPDPIVVTDPAPTPDPVTTPGV